MSEWPEVCQKVVAELGLPAEHYQPMDQAYYDGLFEERLVKVNAEDPAVKNYRDSNVKASGKVFSMLGIEPGKLFADWGYLSKSKQHHFNSPNEARLAAEYVLENPEFSTDESGGNKGLVRRGDNGNPKVKVRLRQQGGSYHIRSVHILNDAQYERQKNKSMRHSASKDASVPTDMQSSDQLRTSPQAHDKSVADNRNNRQSQNIEAEAKRNKAGGFVAAPDKDRARSVAKATGRLAKWWLHGSRGLSPVDRRSFNKRNQLQEGANVERMFMRTSFKQARASLVKKHGADAVQQSLQDVVYGEITPVEFAQQFGLGLDHAAVKVVREFVGRRDRNNDKLADTESDKSCQTRGRPSPHDRK